MKICLLALFVIACSPSQRAAPATGAASTAGSASASGSTGSQAGGSASMAPAAGCPATFAAASGHCAMTKDSCTYPQGACYCGDAPWCGGAAPPPPNPATFTWQCTPNVRADGCPGSTPGNSATCSHDGQTCDYTCSCAESARCTAGHWVIERGPCKP